jgi:hypothetical protein
MAVVSTPQPVAQMIIEVFEHQNFFEKCFKPHSKQLWQILFSSTYLCHLEEKDLPIDQLTKPRRHEGWAAWLN